MGRLADGPGLLQKLAGGLVTVPGPLFQAAENESFHVPGDRGRQFRGRRRGCVEKLVGEGCRGFLSIERKAPRGQLIKDYAQREDVGANIEELALDPFGG